MEKNKTIFDDDEFTGTFEYNDGVWGNTTVKIGMLDLHEHMSICANCKQGIVMPYPVTKIWYHTGSGYGDRSCTNPVPAPTFFLLQLENAKGMDESGHRYDKKIKCKKHFEYWDELINRWLGAKKQSKQGWTSGKHYLKTNYQTACGKKIPYNQRKKGVFVTDKEPKEPTNFEGYTSYDSTCKKCWNWYQKNIKKKKVGKDPVFEDGKRLWCEDGLSFTHDFRLGRYGLRFELVSYGFISKPKFLRITNEHLIGMYTPSFVGSAGINRNLFKKGEKELIYFVRHNEVMIKMNHDGECVWISSKFSKSQKKQIKELFK